MKKIGVSPEGGDPPTLQKWRFQNGVGSPPTHPPPTQKSRFQNGVGSPPHPPTPQNGDFQGVGSPFFKISRENFISSSIGIDGTWFYWSLTRPLPLVCRRLRTGSFFGSPSEWDYGHAWKISKRRTGTDARRSVSDRDFGIKPVRRFTREQAWGQDRDEDSVRNIVSCWCGCLSKWQK